jgi:type IX secretion system PorP/SprF family membrane protein
MPNRILTLIFVISLLPKLIFGQQDPQLSQYFFNQLYLNPSIAGVELAPKITLLHRSQYIGYTSNFDEGGTLNTQLLSFQMPLSKSNSGVGLVIVNDQAGLENNQQVKLSFAKNFKTQGGVFSIGASAGFYYKEFDDSFRPREVGDPNIPSGDSYSQLQPDFGIGVYYTAKSYFGGLSIDHITNPKFDFGATNGNSIINRTVNGIVGFVVPVSQSIELKPNILLRTDLQTYTLEGGIVANVGNKYWLGANYRRQDAAVFMAGVNLMKDNSLKLGAAYDLVLVEKSIKSASSIEFMLSYVIGNKTAKSPKIPQKQPIIRTPRYRH